MKAVLSVIALLAAAGGGEKVAWEKPDAAFGTAAAAGRPVCLYFLTTEIVKGEGGG